MKTQVALFALFLAVSFSVSQANVQKCLNDMTSAIAPLMSGGMTNMEETKSKVCPIMEKFYRCGLKEAFTSKPTEDQIKTLKDSMAQSSSAFTNQLDCNINLDQIVDETWNSASSARPLSILATIMVAFTALFMSAKKL